MAEKRAAFQVPVGQRQLFLDDEGIAKTKNLNCTMHQPEKKGAVIKPYLQASQTAIQTRGTAIWDPLQRVYKLWDISTPADLHAKRIYCAGYYESTDGVHWRRPVMGQIEYQGSRENNFVAVIINGQCRRPDCVVYDPADSDPTRRFKGLSYVDGGVLPIVSDGMTWQPLDVPPITSADEYNLSLDEVEHRFIATVKQAGPHGRSVYLSTSNDFEHWPEPELIFYADELDQELGHKRIEKRFANPRLKAPEYDIPATYNVDVYNMGVFRYEGLYIGLPSMFNQSGQAAKDWNGFDDMGLSPEILKLVRQYGDWTGFHHVQLACSRDLRHWKRLGNREPFIDASPVGGGAYDLQCIIGPSYPVIRGDQLWLYYTGMKNYAYISSAQPDSGAICLAVLRRDGFISLDAGEDEGILETRPFTLTGSRLYLNCDALKGEVCVQILRNGGKVVAVSNPITGNQLRSQIHWKQADLGSFNGQLITLRFSLRDAQMYSYWMEE